MAKVEILHWTAKHTIVIWEKCFRKRIILGLVYRVHYILCNCLRLRFIGSSWSSCLLEWNSIWFKCGQQNEYIVYMFRTELQLLDMWRSRCIFLKNSGKVLRSNKLRDDTKFLEFKDKQNKWSNIYINGKINCKKIINFKIWSFIYISLNPWK